MAKADVIDVVEAAYDLAGDEEEWLRGLARASAPLLDRGIGVTAFAFDFSGRSPTPLVGGPITTGPEGAVSGTIEAMGSAPAPMLAHVFRAVPGIYSARDRLPRADRGPFADRVAEIGRKHELPAHVRSDLLIASEPSGVGVALIAMGREPGEITPRERALWAPVAVHVATALRLRRAARASAAGEAILTPDGRLEHAEAGARSRSSREALREAARAIDRARGRTRHERPEEALALWRGLCAGHWSLVDRFEADGRRYLVAFRNEPSLRDPRALTAREKQIAAHAALGYPNKLIAYALGLSLSTVGWHLSRAMLKLGVTSRAELVRLLNAIGAPPGGAP